MEHESKHYNLKTQLNNYVHESLVILKLYHIYNFNDL